MKAIRQSLNILIAACLSCATSGFSQLPTLDKPSANLTERWQTNASGWITRDNADVTRNGWISNAFAIRYNAVQNQLAFTDSMIGGTNASSGRFVGNYTNANIEAVTFDVNSYGIPPFDNYGNKNNPAFFFRDGAGVRWYYGTDTIPCNTASNWVNVSIPLAYSSNWFGEGALTSSTSFYASKTTVSEIGVMVQQFRNMSANQCAIRNVKLVGPWGGPFTNGVSVAWLAENSLAISNALSNVDNFGRPLLVEFLACTDPNNSNDVFRVEISRNSMGKTVLKWKENNKYARYDLLEGTDLNVPLTFTNMISHMHGSGTQSVAEVDGEMVSGPRFYKIQVRVP